MKRFPIICNYFFFIFHIFHNVKSVLKRVEVSVLQEVLFDCHMEQKEIDNWTSRFDMSSLRTAVAKIFWAYDS